MSEELRDPFPELHQRATLAWGRVRRHPDYKKEATDCLNSLPQNIQQKLSSFMAEYPPGDAERWILAKGDAPLPVHRSGLGRFLVSAAQGSVGLMLAWNEGDRGRLSPGASASLRYHEVLTRRR